VIPRLALPGTYGVNLAKNGKREECPIFTINFLPFLWAMKLAWRYEFRVKRPEKVAY